MEGATVGVLMTVELWAIVLAFCAETKEFCALNKVVVGKDVDVDADLEVPGRIKAVCSNDEPSAVRDETLGLLDADAIAGASVVEVNTTADRDMEGVTSMAGIDVCKCFVPLVQDCTGVVVDGKVADVVAIVVDAMVLVALCGNVVVFLLNELDVAVDVAVDGLVEDAVDCVVIDDDDDDDDCVLLLADDAVVAVLVVVVVVDVCVVVVVGHWPSPGRQFGTAD